MYEPLALEYIAAGVAEDHEVRILDLRLEDRLEDVLAGFRPDIVGITAYTIHVNTVRRLFDEVKRWNPDVLTVVGGHHATVVPEDFISRSIDLIVLGEGISTFKEIVERYGKKAGFDGIPGLAFAKGDSLVRSDYSPNVDLDASPFPARHLTADYRKRYYSEWMRPLASMRTSKGCPFRCSFCAQWKLAGGRYFKRSPEKVVEELSTIDEKYVFFADDESLVDVKRMKALARLINDTGLRKRYFLYGRSDTIAKNPDLLEMWRDVGLERIFIGLEFFRDEDLEYVGKGSKAADNEKAVRIVQDLGIEIYASFIVRPEFTREDFAAFRQYCRHLRLKYASYAALTPLPGTDFYQQVEGQLTTRNYDYFDFNHALLPTTLPLKDYYAEVYKLYRYGVPPITGLLSLRKYPIKEIPATLRMYFKILSQLKNAYRDHEGARHAVPLPYT